MSIIKRICPGGSQNYSASDVTHLKDLKEKRIFDEFLKNLTPEQKNKIENNNLAHESDRLKNRNIQNCLRNYIFSKEFLKSEIKSLIFSMLTFGVYCLWLKYGHASSVAKDVLKSQFLPNPLEIFYESPNLDLDFAFYGGKLKEKEKDKDILLKFKKAEENGEGVVSKLIENARNDIKKDLLRDIEIRLTTPTLENEFVGDIDAFHKNLKEGGFSDQDSYCILNLLSQNIRIPSKSYLTKKTLAEAKKSLGYELIHKPDPKCTKKLKTIINITIDDEKKVKISALSYDALVKKEPGKDLADMKEVLLFKVKTSIDYTEKKTWIAIKQVELLEIDTSTEG